MLDALKAIDLSTVDKLRTIRTDQKTLEERIGRLEEKRDEVSVNVYQRVYDDYAARLQDLEDAARPLKDEARAAYGKLKGIVDEIDANLQAAESEREELALRKELGEFDEEEFKEKIAQCNALVGQYETELAEAKDLKEKFIQSVRSEDELLGALPSEGEGTPIGEGDGGGTTLLNRPRLRLRSSEGVGRDFMLSLGSTRIGRSPNSDICLGDEMISREHARIDCTENGFLIVDEKSENGVFVNGEKVEMRLLAHRDSIAFGTKSLEFEFLEYEDEG